VNLNATRQPIRGDPKNCARGRWGLIASPPHCEKQDQNRRFYRDAVRNRQDVCEFHTTRDLIQKEFILLWDKQKKLSGELAGFLTDGLRKQLDDPAADETWQQRGVIFGQRKTYWNVGTLGRSGPGLR